MKISYARGFPYGAPMVWIRGGATKDPYVRQYLKARGFWYAHEKHGWESAMYADEFLKILVALRDHHGCEVVPKANMDANYVIDLDAEYNLNGKV